MIFCTHSWLEKKIATEFYVDSSMYVVLLVILVSDVCMEAGL